MRALILLCVFLTLPLYAQSLKDGPWMTGERLLRMLTYPPGAKNNFDLTPDQYIDSERARSYIDGVHDMSEGKSWCYSERYQPGDEALHADVVMGLRKLPPGQLKRNAADLIVEIWGKRWPCADRRRQP